MEIAYDEVKFVSELARLGRNAAKPSSGSKAIGREAQQNVYIFIMSLISSLILWVIRKFEAKNQGIPDCALVKYNLSS
jgi:hypothetical protein